MTRRAADLDASLRIVVVAACHFSEDAARAITHLQAAGEAVWQIGEIRERAEGQAQTVVV